MNGLTIKCPYCGHDNDYDEVDESAANISIVDPGLPCGNCGCDIIGRSKWSNFWDHIEITFS